MRVLVVCHGNVNRSPLCAAVLRRDRPDWEVREAALKSTYLDWRPERAAKKMRDAAADYGLDLSGHRSQPISEASLEWADAVIFMDQGNYRRLQALSPTGGPGGGRQWVSLGSFVGRSRIPDPAFLRRGSNEFNDVVSLILSASRECANKLIAVDF